MCTENKTANIIHECASSFEKFKQFLKSHAMHSLGLNANIATNTNTVRYTHTQV